MFNTSTQKMASGTPVLDAELVKRLDENIKYYEEMKAHMEQALRREKDCHAKGYRACLNNCDCITVIEDFLFELEEGDALCKLIKQYNNPVLT